MSVLSLKQARHKQELTVHKRYQNITFRNINLPLAEAHHSFSTHAKRYNGDMFAIMPKKCFIV